MPLRFPVLTLCAILGVTACGGSGPADAPYHKYVIAAGEGRACVKQGMVRDMRAAAAYLDEADSVVRNIVPAAQQATTQAFILNMSNTPASPAVCAQFELAAAGHSNAQAAKAQQIVVIQQPAMPVPWVRQTICTNVGGGMAACNTY